MKRTKYHLAFNNQRSYGSPKHFFIYIWGYLLPALYLMDQMQLKASQNTKVTFTLSTCGPVMDQLMASLFTDLGYAFTIAAPNEVAAETTLLVPRWDILMRYSVNRHPRKGMAFRKRLAGHYHWLRQWQGMRQLHGHIRAVHHLVARHMPLKATATAEFNYGALQNTYLIIQRSAPPKNYERSALNKEATDYGIERRSLNGVEAAVTQLGQAGIKAMAFEPGIHDITHQINMFYHCKGIIGIRGAEFANMVWLRPGSTCIMIDTTHIDAPPPQRILAQAMGLQYTELSTNQKHTTLNVNSVLDLLKQ